MERLKDTRKKTFDGYTLDKVLNKIKTIIGIEIFYDAKVLIDTNDKLLDEVTLKNSVILITSIKKFILKYF